WAERAAAFVARRPGVPAGLRSQLDRLADRYDRVAAHLAALAPTVIHGEFYASNILVRDGPPTGPPPHPPAGPRICPVDWEMAAVGPGLLDLATLTAGDWTDEQRAAMVAAYRQALADAGVPLPPPADMWESLDHCRLHLAVQWLGWAENWA